MHSPFPNAPKDTSKCKNSAFLNRGNRPVLHFYEYFFFPRYQHLHPCHLIFDPPFSMPPKTSANAQTDSHAGELLLKKGKSMSSLFSYEHFSFFQDLNFSTTVISYLTHLPLLNAPEDISKHTKLSIHRGIAF